MNFSKIRIRMANHDHCASIYRGNSPYKALHKETKYRILCLKDAWFSTLLNSMYFIIWLLWAMPTWMVSLQAKWSIWEMVISYAKNVILHLLHRSCQMMAHLSISQAKFHMFMIKLYTFTCMMLEVISIEIPFLEMPKCFSKTNPNAFKKLPNCFGGLALCRAMFKGLHNVKPPIMAFTILIHTNVENSNMEPLPLGVKLPQININFFGIRCHIISKKNLLFFKANTKFQMSFVHLW